MNFVGSRFMPGDNAKRQNALRGSRPVRKRLSIAAERRERLRLLVLVARRPRAVWTRVESGLLMSFKDHDVCD